MIVISLLKAMMVMMAVEVKMTIGVTQSFPSHSMVQLTTYSCSEKDEEKKMREKKEEKKKEKKTKTNKREKKKRKKKRLRNEVISTQRRRAAEEIKLTRFCRNRIDKPS